MARTNTTSEAPSIGAALERNIRALESRRRAEAACATREERLAAAITRFTGSMRFVWMHLVLFGGWIAINLSLVPGVPRFDASLVMLAMVASVEAIFLSTFVLISQNRMAGEASARAELDLQISLLTEHELTHLAKLLAEIAERVGVEAAHHPQMQEVTAAIAPEAVIDAIEAEQGPARG